MATGVSGVTGTTPTTGSTATSDISRNAKEMGMGQDAFLKLLVAQVRYQDPSKPIDSSQFMAQTAQFSMVEQLGKLQEAQTQMLAFQRVLFSADLVGKQVSGTNALGREVSGVVDTVRILNGSASVMIGKEELPVDSITRILAPSGGTAPTTT